MTPAQQAHSALVTSHLRQLIAQSEGWLAFEQWMAAALYAPGLGYYDAGSPKLAHVVSAGGAALSGDFVTAPQLTPLFARTLANQVEQIFDLSDSAAILEFGAGTGALANDMIDTLAERGRDVHYTIIEVSAHLRAMQRARLARHGHRVRWLDRLPDRFEGCVLANEVLDAMPVTVFRYDRAGSLQERGVIVDASGDFAWADRPADHSLRATLAGRLPVMPGYVSEINRQAEAWVQAMGSWLSRGAALIVDYGFPQSEYYHPQRAEGTLMCHTRHRTHSDVLASPGMQDITAHVDFTAMAQAALDTGLDLLGFTSQARFLTNAGITAELARVPASDALLYASSAGPVQKLLSEAEMGELFKVLAIGRGIDRTLLGFSRRDRRHTL